MYKINFNTPLRVHFIGIGGISMSGLAEILINQHFSVSGSDIIQSTITQHLTSLGADIQIGHRRDNIPENTELVVYTAAIKQDNIEYITALERNIPMMDRAELLGQIMGNFSCSIGVSGTHGKTTTTSMLSQVFIDHDLDPTISVGGILDLLGGNIRVGNSAYFITEACEYANSFLKFRPYVALILNIEEDHLDFFKDLADIRSSFKRYIKNIPDDGSLIINNGIPDYEELLGGVNCKIITYGSEENKPDFFPRHIVFDKLGCPSYDLYYKNQFVLRVDLSAKGMHNVYNSLAVFAVAHTLGLDLKKSQKSLEHFVGPKRRFEYKGSLKGVTIVDDYAHHPTEIRATLNTARNSNPDQLWVVFQPHTYSRTKSFLADFADALAIADHVILADIYAAREKDPGDISSVDLQKLLKEKNVKCDYFSSFDDIEIFILENCIPGDLLITMGAGNIYLVGEDLLHG